MKKTRKINATTQAIIAFSVFLIAVYIIMGQILVSRVKNSMKSVIQQRMLDIVRTAAGSLDGDALSKVRSWDDIGTPDYNKVNDVITIYLENINLSYIYCVRDAGDGKYILTVSPSFEDEEEFGIPIVYSEALGKAAKGQVAVDEEPTEDQWGKYYSAFAPVYDSNHNIAGIVGVDFDALWYENEIKQFSISIVLNGILSLLVGILIVGAITGRIIRRFRILNRGVTDLETSLDNLKTMLGSVDEDDRDIIDIEDSESPRIKGDISELSDKVRMMKSDIENYLSHRNAQAYSMITALSSDFRALYNINLEQNKGTCYQHHAEIDSGMENGEHFDFLERFEDYANNFVHESYREEFLEFIQPEHLKEALSENTVITFLYLTTLKGKEAYELMKVVRINHDEEEADEGYEISIALADVDTETRRTLDQSQALSDALEAAKEANKAKTAFLSSMSHEIRTPMNAIIGLDSIALSDADISDKTRDYLAKIGSSAQHLLKIINDILDMSRIESGRMTLSEEEFSLVELIEQINTMIGGQCQEKGLTYRCNVGDDTGVYFIGDAMKLKQIFINILGNAVKFTDEGGVIEFTTEKVIEYANNTTLRFTMSDTGVGMSEDFLPKIFDTFSQEDSSATNKYGSTGLGMSITKNLVDMMNGTIEVTSKKGEGSTFVVSITFSKSGREEKGDEQTPVNNHEIAALFVSTNTVACTFARNEMNKAGIALDVAMSEEEAEEMIRLRFARRKSYNMVIVDRDMPMLDPVEVCRNIRVMLGESLCITILMSYDTTNLAEVAKAAEADLYMRKPVSGTPVLDEFKKAILVKEKEVQASTSAKDLTGKRVLLAEDMDINAEIMEMILEVRSMEVERAHNGKEAVDMFFDHPEGYYDVILMDMRMPEMDGLTATSIIRKLGRPDSELIPIIALTANAFDEDVQRSLQAGLNAHLSKPVEPDILFETLQTLIP